MAINKFDILEVTLQASSNFYKPAPYEHFPAISMTAVVCNCTNLALRETKIESKAMIDGEPSFDSKDQAVQRAVAYLSDNYESILEAVLTQIIG